MDQTYYFDRNERTISGLLKNNEKMNIIHRNENLFHKAV